MDKSHLESGIKKALESKGKRKFKQSVELIINTRGVNFSKPENRLKLNIVLPSGLGKVRKVAVFGDDSVVRDAKQAGADLTILPDQVEEYKDHKKLSELANNYVLLAHPKMMSIVAKNFGQYLGRKGKLPTPIIGKVSDFIDRARRTVRIRSKGKYLPTLQTMVGTEDLDVPSLVENCMAVYSKVLSKITEGNIKSVYVKLTMGKSVKI